MSLYGRSTAGLRGERTPSIRFAMARQAIANAVLHYLRLFPALLAAVPSSNVHIGRRLGRNR